MTELNFEYFIGGESDQFSFIKVPKIFFIETRFEVLSYGAKILYGLLLDRMSLSKKNNWLDDTRRVYVIYTIEKIHLDFNVSKTLAVRFLQELEDFGLIEKRKRPNAATMIYVKNFILSEFEDVEVQNQEVQNQEVQNMDFQNVEFQAMEYQKEPKIQGSPKYGSPQNGIPGFHKMESNKTLDEDDNNYFISSSSMSEKDAVNLIREKVNYKEFLGNKNNYLIDELIQTLADFILSQKTVCSIDKRKVTMADAKKNVLEKSTQSNFELILNNIAANGTGTIYNLQNYVVTCFYRLHKVESSFTGKSDFNHFQQNKYDFVQLEKELTSI